MTALASTAITYNYAWLLSEVATWLHRDDLTARIPVFIAMAETKMSDDLEARSMEAMTSLSTVAGDAYVDLPSDCKSLMRVYVDTDPDVLLKYVAPEELVSDYPWSSTGQPLVYTVIANQIQLAPVPDAVYTLKTTYIQRLPALATNEMNWLLSRSPQAYIFGALTMAQPFLVNDARLPMFAQMYKDAIDGVNHADWHNGATMSVRQDVRL